MRSVIAVIQPYRLTDVKKALDDLELGEVEIAQATDYGCCPKCGAEQSRERELQPRHLVRLEIHVPAALANAVVRIIMRQATVGGDGEGEIFVLETKQTNRIASLFGEDPFEDLK